MVTGTENTLKALIDTEIKAAILVNTGTAAASPNALDSISEGIANAIIPHFVGNADILPGTFAVSGSGPVTGIGLMI